MLGLQLNHISKRATDKWKGNSSTSHELCTNLAIWCDLLRLGTDKRSNSQCQWNNPEEYGVHTSHQDLILKQQQGKTVQNKTVNILMRHVKISTRRMVMGEMYSNFVVPMGSILQMYIVFYGHYINSGFVYPQWMSQWMSQISPPFSVWIQYVS